MLLTLQFARNDVRYDEQNGVASSKISLYGKITDADGDTAFVFEDLLADEIPTDLLPEAIRHATLWQKAVPLAPGDYRLTLAVKDRIGDAMTVTEETLTVPAFDDVSLAASSLILADQVATTASQSLAGGAFLIGASQVRPRPSFTFHRGEAMSAYFQIYNARPGTVVEYSVLRDARERLHFTTDLAARDGSSRCQVAVRRPIPLDSLEPGNYSLQVTVTTANGAQAVNQHAAFKIE